MNDNFKEIKVHSAINNYWLITFTDLISLMVAFFVMLYAMSSPKEEMFKYKVEGMDTLNKEKNLSDKGKKASVFGLNRTFARRAVSLEYLEVILSSKIEEDDLFKDIKINLFEDSLIISLSLTTFLYKQGGAARVKPEKEKVIFEIADMLGNIKNKISVMAYYANSKTENFYVDTSLAYAAAVRNMLKEKGYKDQIDICSGMENRVFNNLNLSEVIEEAYINRVDIIISEEGQIFE